MCQKNPSFSIVPRELKIVGNTVGSGAYSNVDPALRRRWRGIILGDHTVNQHTVCHLSVMADREDFGVSELVEHMGELGYRPGTHEELLGYGAGYPNALPYPLIALGSEFKVEGESQVCALVITPYNVRGSSDLGRSIGFIPREPCGKKGWTLWWKFLVARL